MSTVSPGGKLSSLPGGAVEHEEFRSLVEEMNPRTALGALGIRVDRYDPEEFRISLEIDERHRQHLGMLHGGVSALLAESAASLAAAMAVDLRTKNVAGVDLNATHLRPVARGRVSATARPLYRGRTTHVYEVLLTDEAEQLFCAARCTVAIRPRRVHEPAGAS